MSPSSEARPAMDAVRKAVTSTEAAFRALRVDVAPAMERLGNVVESLIAQLKSSDALLVPLLSGVTGSSSSAHAAVDVTILSLRIGMELRYSHSELSRLGQVAVLHDLGRGDRPAGRREGAPRAAGGRASGRESELVAIADLAATFVSLSRQQPTGPRAWPPLAMKETLRRERTRVPDPILKALIQISLSFPVGGLVRLNSGEIGCVVGRNPGLPLRPVIAIQPRRGQPPAPVKLVDLHERPFLYVREFLGYEHPDDVEAEDSPW